MSIPQSRFIRPVLNNGFKSTTPRDICTLPELIEFNARENPGHVFAMQMHSHGDLSSRNITFADLKQAVEHASAWLVNVGATGGKTSPDQAVAPVAILLGSDVSLFIYIAALLRLGTPVVVISPRLTPVAIAHVIQATSPSKIIVSSQVSRSITEALGVLKDSERAVPSTLDALGVDTLLDAVDPALVDLPIPASYPADPDALDFIMHTSGSTGHPKPVFLAQRYFIHLATSHAIPEQDAPLKPLFSTLPLYHTFGLSAPSISLATGMPVALPPSTTIPTARSALAYLKYSGARNLFLVPSILEDLASLPDRAGIRALQKLDMIVAGGAAIKESVGDMLVSHGCKLWNGWGTTEVGIASTLQAPFPGYDFRYIFLRSDIKYELHQPSDGSYNIAIYRPGYKEPFVVQDFVEKHPDQPSQFKILGRSDDLVVLGNGEKVRPTLVEHAVQEHPAVSAVVAFGEGHESMGLLIELQGHPEAVDLKSLTPPLESYLARANALVDNAGKIAENMLIFTHADTNPLPRTAKGTLARKAVVSAFAQEIEDCYARVDITPATPLPLPFNDDGAALRQALRALVKDALRMADNEVLLDDTDLFEFGMDSLQATRLRRDILNGLRATKGLPAAVDDLPTEFVYQNPTLGLIATRVAEVMGGVDVGDGTSRESRRIKAMEDMVQTFTEELKTYSGVAARAKEARVRNLGVDEFVKHTVLLTGSTGSLGCLLLARLATDPHVKKIICLNRPQQGAASIRECQIHLMERRGAAMDSALWSKVAIFEADTSRPDFGLSEENFKELLDVTHVIHNAWPVNFNRTLASFKSHVQALCNLVHLLLLSAAEHPSDRRSRRIQFTSSVAVVGRYSLFHPDGPLAVPEVPFGPSVSSDFGYPEGKWVGERVLLVAAQLYGKPEDGAGTPLLATSTVRIGQMTGPEGSGAWNENEHFPIVVRTSQKLKAVPSLEGSLSWMPVDRSADVLTELLLSKTFRPIYHMENPSRQTWSGIIGMLATLLGGDFGPLPSLPYKEWLDRARALGEDPETNIALKIMDFLENDFEPMTQGDVILGTSGAKDDSRTLTRSTALDRRHMEEYVAYWRRVGALEA
ncbi:hypothetical protein OF83DRAFT_1235553 [Amylostereum chailletii]|nr:hypothetical protein OF83DRAFT_1235553 [Amylostereum chailletii]